MRSDDEQASSDWICRSERVATNLPADVRQGGPSRIPAVVINLSTSGFQIRCEERLRRDSRIWVRIGTLAPLMARVIWSNAYCAGCVFRQPLHPAILDHLASAGK